MPRTTYLVADAGDHVVPPPPLDAPTLALIGMAVREDMGGAGDRTVQASIPAGARGTGTIIARQAGTICGTFLLPAILREYEAGLECAILAADGTGVLPNQAVARISGNARGILSAERVLLNFMGHLSGISSATRRFVDAVALVPTPAGRPPDICDTRKTLPGYRALDKHAVRCGGGVNHRMGLYDGVMLKDNHLAALRQQLGKDLTLAQLTAQLRATLPREILLWLEVDTLEQLADALPGGGADIILLDNMQAGEVAEAVQMRNAHSPQGRPALEASGRITLANVAAMAATGVERISIGALTHSAAAMDLSMEFV